MPTITSRKLIRFGDGLVITLPKGWVRYYGLKAGDRLEVITNEVLTINPIREQEQKLVTQYILNLTTLHPHHL